MRPNHLLGTFGIILVAACAAPTASSGPGSSAPVPPATASAAIRAPTMTMRADVPTYRGNAARSGVMPDPGPVADPSVRWKLELDGPIHSSPVVAADVVYVATDSGSLYALDLATGRQRWLVHASTSALSTPDIVDGMVLVGTETDGLRAFDATSGEPRWSVAADGQVAGAPADMDGVVVFATEAGSVVAVDATTGVKRWTAPAGAPVYSSLAIDDGLVVVGTNAGSIVAFALADGAVRWSTDVGDVGRVGTPAIDDGRVFGSTGLDSAGPPSHHVVALDAGSGRILWRYASPIGAAVYTPAVSGTRAFVTSEDGSVAALDVATGAFAWTAKVDRPVEVVPAIAGTAVYAASNGGSAFAIDVATGMELWRTAIKGRPYGPTVAGGQLLLGTDLGMLVAIGGTVP